MPLATLDDLTREPADVIAGFRKWAEELKSMYDRFIETDDEDEEFQVSWGSSTGRAAGIHASEISGCQRRSVYTLMGTKKQEGIKAMWKRKFRLGHLVHQMLQRDFHRMCAKTGGLITFTEEARIKPELQELARRLDIHSSCDGIFTFHDDIGGPAILRVALEIKSASPDEWVNLKEPKPEHVEQSTMYQRCLDVPLKWILYYNKGTQNMTPSEDPWLTLFDHRLWGEIENRIGERHENARLKVLPERTEGIGCDFCPYGWTCEPQYLKKKAAREAAKQARDRTAKRARRLRGPVRTT